MIPAALLTLGVLTLGWLPVLVVVSLCFAPVATLWVTRQ